MTQLKLYTKQVEEIVHLLRFADNLNLGRRTEVAQQLMDRLRPMTAYTCVVCGKTGWQSRGRPRKTCSDECRWRLWHQKRGSRAVKREAFTHWSEEEKNKLIECLQHYHGTDHWALGQRAITWGAIATEVGRSVKAVQTMKKNLVRQGVIQESETTSRSGRLER